MWMKYDLKGFFNGEGGGRVGRVEINNIMWSTLGPSGHTEVIKKKKKIGK